MLPPLQAGRPPGADQPERSPLHHECFAREAACADWRKEFRHLPQPDQAVKRQSTLGVPAERCSIRMTQLGGEPMFA
jgi:hypothetical protein